MIIEIFKTIAIGAPVVFVTAYAYVHLLLCIAKFSAGIVKLVLSMVVYLASCPLFVAPLIFLVDDARFAIKESTWAFGYVVAGYAAIAAPGFYYLAKIKIQELQRAGYFLPEY
ncbi:hypothetical protein AWR36_008525 [Microbulbifer flavimaris]|uniref:Uncharacterized protein n=1 Tax=Microbulbifer flavimaris TaxID=1781068 RepID=A0ABX4I0U4_9GAMM|nr:MULTISPECIES: hypothetical protein [Microbulbifer]KUJ83850.1 hypothetical protein AVO43_08495 [Microbulbifer sp. ZGT114]PCO06027.1 hypothetical protein AWR36_008525 [Microbulbifer flavimaris]